MRAGTLKDRVTIQRWTAENDPTWGPSPGWNAIGDVWANVTPVSGTEKPDAAGVQTTITHRIIMRYRADVTTKDRIIYRGRVLDIAYRDIYPAMIAVAMVTVGVLGALTTQVLVRIERWAVPWRR